MTSCGTVVQKVDSPVVNTGTAQKGSTVSTTAATAENTETTAITETTETTTINNVSSVKVMRGNLYDADGDLLMFSQLDESGKEVRMTNDSNKVAFANVLNEMSEGIDLTLDKTLRVQNPTATEGGDYGQSIQLTFDADAQNAVYNYMAEKNVKGAAVVMRSDGSIMAQVSYPSYDPDVYYGVETEEDLAWGTYGNKAFQNFPPGSCFKIMSEVIADKHGVYSLQDEGEWKFDGVSIVNWDHDTNGGYPMQRSLYSAFVNSSNIFFARAFDQIGQQAVLEDLDTIFHFGTDIECDFGVIGNNIEIYCNDDLRRTAFGQSYTLTCPIYLAALGREAIYGDMVRPFVVKNIVDTNDFNNKIEKGSEPNDVIGTIPAECRQNLLDGMRGVASGLGVYVPEGYEFYAKTGTAETWENDFLYITGAVKNINDDGTGVYTDYNDYNGSYIIAMQIRNPEYFGFSFASESASIYQGIVNAVLNS
ncbi:MAG: peptidoglycan glycosyltransferase [Ruminococcus sp.]|nr:peptidoglycan glycosyltransferase [Ruminococcus sp.]